MKSTDPSKENLSYHKVSKEMWQVNSFFWVELAEKRSWRWDLSGSLKIPQDLPRLGMLFQSQKSSLRPNATKALSSSQSKGTNSPHSLTLHVFERYFLGTQKNICSIRGSNSVNPTGLRADQSWTPPSLFSWSCVCLILEHKDHPFILGLQSPVSTSVTIALFKSTG